MSVASEPLMQVRGLTAGYGRSQVLFGIDLDLPPRGALAILGRNGAGKTTLLRALMGEIPAMAGSIHLDQHSLIGEPPEKRVRRGLGYVPQEGAVFAGMTVRDNLKLGLLGASGGTGFEEALAMFPKLSGRLDQLAGSLSGGERKMLAISRAILGAPHILLLDEPTEGVWTGVIDEIAERLQALAERICIVMVEQHLDLAWQITSQAWVMDRGKMVLGGHAAAIREHPQLLEHLAP